MNGTWQKVLTGVGVAVILASLLGIVDHVMFRGIHQTEKEKENQTYVWFCRWWDEKFAKDIQPEFDELKQLIREK